MNYTLKIFILFLVLYIIACNEDKPTDNGNIKCGDKIIVSEELFDSAPDHYFNYDKIEIIGDCLKISVRYGGGCGEVEFKLIDKGELIKTNPPQRTIRLSFYDNDPCEALLRKDLSYEISSLKESSTNKIVLNFAKMDTSLTYSY